MDLGKVAGSTGLEPATSGVTGQRSNQLNYDPAKQLQMTPLARLRASRSTHRSARRFGVVGGTGIEPVTVGV